MIRKLMLVGLASLVLFAPSSLAYAQAVSLTESSVATSKSAARMFGEKSEGKFKKNRLHLKLRADAGMQLVGDDFVSASYADTVRLNRILATAKRIKVAKLSEPVTGGESAVHAQVKHALGQYYIVTFAKDIDVVAVAAELEAITTLVETAYPEPLPAPAAAAPNYTSLMNYFQAAPTGIDTAYAASYPGANGSKVKIVDIEYSWNTNHTDLLKARNAFVPNGTANDPFEDTAHGTAVIGQLSATANSYGVTGGVPAAGLILINANNLEYGYDPAGALMKAASVVTPGDVVLIEQQTYGPSSGMVPVEWIPSVYDAIRELTAQGVTVIEPAGNGNENLSDTSLYGAPFPMGKPDSGAIMVGAGENCSDATQRRVRLYFSNYGSRINVQGAGNCVVTTGWYGDLYSGDGINSYYTQSFSGTSSASPVVASAAAAVISAHKTLNTDAILSPATVRSILRSTGTPQIIADSPGNIGPLPNLAKALPKTDLTAPSATTITSRFNAKNKPVLTWAAATDNVKVVSYKLYRNGVVIKMLPGLTFTDTSAARGVTYNYKVAAIDSAGRTSAFSNTVTVIGR